jgi:glyoxalase family protein
VFDTPGIHHVSGVAGDAQSNADFYAEALGLRFLVRTVNFEDRFTYHLYYGDTVGTPGTVLTAFSYPREEPGRDGKPAISALALAVPEGSLGWWESRLGGHGVETDARTTRFGEPVLPVSDPDGTRIALVGCGFERGEPFDAVVPAERAVRGVRGVSVRSASPYVTASLLETFGFEHAGEAGARVRYRAPDGAHVDLLTDDAPYAREGRGSIHHVALRVGSVEELHEWRELLDERGFDASRVKDRHFFHSLYVRDPGGILFELATTEPGLGVAADASRPGADLRLPPWLAEDREMIANQLPPLEALLEG